MAATKLAVVVDQGSGTPATITITLTTTSGDPEIPRTQAMAVSRGGFWDDAQANFYPPACIRKVTPQ